MPCLQRVFLCTTLSLLACGPAPSHSLERAPHAVHHKPLDPEALRALVKTLAQQTSSIRGLAWKHDVPVRIESAETITRHMRASLSRAQNELNDEHHIGAALGLYPNEMDMVAVQSSFIGSEGQGYYDPSEGVLVINERDASSLGSDGLDGLSARETLVHEIVHALQHQHFPQRVDEPDGHPPPAGDSARARLMMLEGDATLTAMEWAEQRKGRRWLGTPGFQPRIERWTQNAMVLPAVEVPTYLVVSAEASYTFGVRSMGSLWMLGGWERINTTLADLSLTTSHLLHPDRAMDVRSVPAPPTPSNTTTHLTRTLGELEIRLILGSFMRDERASIVADHWRGDTFALFASNQQWVLRWDIECDTESGAQSMQQALQTLSQRWAEKGCPHMRGGSSNRCPASVTVQGTRVHLERGT